MTALRGRAAIDWDDWADDHPPLVPAPIKASETGAPDGKAPHCARCGGRIDGYSNNFRVRVKRGPRRQLDEAKIEHITCPTPEDLG